MFTNKTKHVYRSINGNTASSYISTEDAKNKAILMDDLGNKNCKDCTDCRYCIGCTGCRECINCQDCRYCTGVTDLTGASFIIV